MNRALLLFVKNPQKGKVKTRLAKTVGDDRALQIYKALLQHTRAISLAVDADRLLYYSQFLDESDDWSNASFQKFVQSGNDLGDRMQQAFQQAFQQYHKVIIIGSDCAELTSAIIENAFAQLDKHAFVIGPALDGGYYLLGMNTYQPTVFENIEWSTASVLEETIQRITQLKQNYYLLPPLSDIDREEDWEKYGWEL